MTAEDVGIAFVALVQLVTLMMIMKRGRSGGTSVQKEEKNDGEAERLKSILSSPATLTAYALGAFKGNEEKAKKAIQTRLKKLTGETFEVPFK